MNAGSFSEALEVIRVSGGVEDIPRLVTAIESVLELHKKSHIDTCTECGEPDDRDEWMHVDYPCQTVKVITAALKG